MLFVIHFVSMPSNISLDAVLKRLTLLAILLFCYGGESVCEKPIRPKTIEVLRSNLVVSQNVYLELANNI